VFEKFSRIWTGKSVAASAFTRAAPVLCGGGYGWILMTTKIRRRNAACHCFPAQWRVRNFRASVTCTRLACDEQGIVERHTVKTRRFFIFDCSPQSATADNCEKFTINE